MVNRKMPSVLTIAALLACAIPTRSVASYLVAPVIGQATPSFPVPDSVTKGTKISIASSSDNMNAISERLAKGFRSQYSGTVDVTTTDANAALQAVLNGNADLAAISRPLSAAEKAKGLIAIPVRREKIAIVVGKANPFASSLTGDQFARIFRGEIKNWSEVGGSAGPVKFIDRPEASDIRQSLKSYPVFAGSEFKAGSNVTKLSEDSTEALAKAIGKDGIGYVLVSQLQNQPGIKAIELHKTLPNNPRYPFSQPYSFVYAGGASPAVAAFLGYATGNPGQSALNGADLSGYAVLPAAGTAVAAANGAGAGTSAGVDTSGSTSASGTADKTASGSADGTAGGTANEPATGNTPTDDGTVVIEKDSSAVVDGANGATDLATDRGRWWWLLLPLAGLALLIWAASKRGTEEETGYIANGGTVEDDKVRGAYSNGSELPNTELGIAEAAPASPAIGTDAGLEASTTSSKPPIFRATDGTAVAGAAVTGAVVAGAAGGRLRDKGGDTTGDTTMDLEGIPGSVKDGIGVEKDSVQSDIKSLESNVQGSVDSDRATFQGVNSPKGQAQTSPGNQLSNVQGDIQGDLPGGIDSTRTNLRSSTDSFKSAQGSSTEGVGSSWLDRAKARINEATDQMKDKASDIKDDVTKE